MDACLPLLARTALLERLAQWEELGEDERERLRRELAVVTAISEGELFIMEVPDPLPLRNITIPPEVTRVEGCTCGGLEFHRAQTVYDPPGSGCAIWLLPPGQAQASVDAAQERMRSFTDALNARLREELAVVTAIAGNELPGLASASPAVCLGQLSTRLRAQVAAIHASSSSRRAARPSRATPPSAP